MRTFLWRSVVAIVCAAIVVLTLPVRARERLIAVSVEGCGELDAVTVERIIDLELGEEPNGNAGEPFELSAEVICGTESVRITADDPLTGKRLEREIPVIDDAEAEPERVVALAASQLFRASWLELEAPAEPPAEPQRDDESNSGDDEIRASEQGEVTVEGGVRLRALGLLLPVAHVGLRGGGTMGPGLGLYGLAAFEYGSDTREIGTVKAYSVWLGLELSQRWLVSRAVAIELGGSVSGGYVRLTGEGANDEIITGAIDGMTGELALLAGPVFFAGDAFVVSIDVQGGYTLPNPGGTVDRGPDVTIGEFWVGAVLRVGLRIG